MLAEKITRPVYVARPLKTHCIHGHPLNAETVLWQKITSPTHARTSYPICRLCRSVSKREYQRRLKASR